MKKSVMKKGIMGLAMAMILSLSANAQGTSSVQDNNNAVLMTVGGEPVTLGEFEVIFKKNNTAKPITKESLDEYIGLFTKFKLKVREAREMKMDTAKAFVNELSGYVKQLAQPYLKDKDAEEKLLVETYDRMKTDLKIRHIVVRLSDCASPKDTLAAWTKIEKIRKELLKTKNFEAAATKYSEDSVSAKNGGYLGYFNTLTLAYAFETAAYNLKVGEVSQPIRTSYGYHLIKVDERRPARGKVKVAHIYVMANKTGDQGSYDLAKKKIDDAYAKILAGEDFAKVVREYSDDYNSSQRGGEIAPFGINQMVQEFEDASFGLKNVGDVSKPFETNIGFHIVKLLEKMETPSYDDYKGELTKVVMKNKRWQTVKDAFTAKLRKEYNVQENPAILAAVESIAAKNGGKISADQLSSIPSQWLLKIGSTEINSSELIASSTPKMQKGAIDVCTFNKTYYQPFISQKILDYKEANLANEYPEFKMLVNEYRDGILLFNLMDQKVWTKSVKDTTGLQQFYEANKTKYMWGDRVHAYILDLRSDTAEQLARKEADKLATGKLTKEKFLATVNKKVKDNVFITDGVYSNGDNKLVDAVGGQIGVGATDKSNGKIKFAVVDRLIAPEPKLLKEAKGLVISDYQNYLEAAWIKELEAKYPVKVNQQVLYTLIGK